jgi:excisionase family DNA binding protein
MEHTTTQIQGITANDLYNQFADLRNSIAEIKQALTSKPCDNELLTREQVANELNITLPTLYDWTKKGLIKSHKIGNRVLYKRGDLTTALRPVKHGK